MVLLETRSRGFVTQASGWLLAQGLAVEWHKGESPGSWALEVPASEAERAAELLGAMLDEDRTRASERSVMEGWTPLVLQPAFAFALSLSGLMLGFYYFVGGSVARTDLFRAGAFTEVAVAGGEWWRYLTAACLHGDWSHVLGNSLFMMVLGWAVAERVGPGVTLLSWGLTAAAGFAASFWFSDVAVTVGASGGLFGLLGVAGAHGFKASWSAELFSRRIRELGAACSLLAFTAFSPQSNIKAHLGGFAAGVIFGALLASRRAAPLWQVVAGATTAGGVIYCWWLTGELGG